jgi:valyl-tRNA synthetase
VAPWPAVPAFHDPAAEAEVAALQELVTEVRRFRSDQGLRPGRRVPARITGLAGALAGHEAEVRSLATLEPAGESFAATASLTAGSVTVDLDLSGVIDVAAERKRLEKDLAAAEKERAQAQGKLGNAQFLAKAPAEVVDKIRVRLEAAEADLARITAQLAALPAA